jgi:uncharacterized protein YjbI with pentapeptide repeats
MAELWKKYWRWIIGVGLVLYTYPFWCLALNDWFGWYLGDLYTFGIDELKDFMTVWIALGGVIAVVVGIFQTQRRIKQQESHFNAQIKKQNKQIRIQHQQLLDARFASGVELLGSPQESARIGGAYSLYFLAWENKEYINTVCEILCAHIRTITSDTNYQEKNEKRPSNEIQSILDLLFRKREFFMKQNPIICDHIFLNNSKDLNATFLCGVNLIATKLWNVQFTGAKLNRAIFTQADLMDVGLLSAELNDASFNANELKKVDFRTAKLFGANFNGAKMINVDYWAAKLNDATNFTETRLAGYTPEEIVQEGRSLEITKPEEENLQ